MKSIKYILLALAAIAVSGLVWLSQSTPVVSQPTVLFSTEPPLEKVIPDDTLVKFQLQALDQEKKTLADANIHVQILTPAKTPWFSSDFPLVEGTKLLDFTAIASQGNLEFEQVLPIRGNYRMEVKVTPQVKQEFEEFEAFEQSSTFSIAENGVKYRNFAILGVILLGVGSISGWVLGGDQTVRENEVAPQPVRMLLSGMTIVAIAVLLLVDLSAEVSAFHSHPEVSGTEVVTSSSPSSPAIAQNQAIKVELLGDTNAVVGNLATQGVQVTSPSKVQPITDVQVRVQSIALENGALMFAYQGIPDVAGKLTWQEQFFDGAPHRVKAEVIPLDNSFESISEQPKPLQVSQEIEVEAIAPALWLRFISLIYFTLFFVAGLIGGFWVRRQKANRANLPSLSI